jgi:hypothetical protein
LLGFALGALFTDWQVVVETGQALAGIVRYPADNPFFIYHLKLWSLLNQLSGWLLAAGVSERVLSVLVSGLLGVVSMQALAIVIYALSRDAMLAIGAPFAIFAGGATNYGVVYPISLLGTQHTYGVIGLSGLVLVAGLVGAGRTRLAGFLLGVAPAVHPSLGVFLGLLLGLAALPDLRATWAACRAGLRPFLIGCGVTIASLIVQRIYMRGLPEIAPAEATRYLNAFVGFWDAHRGPVDFGRMGIAINVAVAGVAWLWLRRSRTFTVLERFLLRFVIISGALSLGLAFLSHLPPSSIPPAVLVLMPSRLLNVCVFVGPAVLLGLAGRTKSAVTQAIVLALLVAILLSIRSELWRLLAPEGSRVIAKLGLATFIVAAIVAMATVWFTARRKGLGVVHAATTAVLAASVGLSFMLAIERVRAQRDWLLKDWTNERMFGFAAREPGYLLTGGDLHLIQLRSRRPVLLDGGGLDALPYTLEAGPETNRILKDIYGVDLFAPPEDARGTGAVPLQTNQRIWEAYSLSRWKEIASTYGVTQVMTPGEWHLQLPIVAAGQGAVLYSIPK